MAAELRRLAEAGCDLRNGYVCGTLDLSHGGDYPQPVSSTAAEAWAELCHGVTCVSVWPDGEDHNCVRYDEPGRMHPLQHAPLMFAPAELEGMEYDQIGQLREKCDRLVIVEDGR